MSNFIRFIKILRILVRYRIDVLLFSTPFLKRFKPLLYLTPWHYIPRKKRSRGKRIRLALEELGPIFIKFGQTLSTRRDLLPNDIGDELAKLQDSCPSFSGKQAQKMIEKSLGEPIDKLFKIFDIKPLASASIAQVHTAITHNNNEVAIKVVRPNIEKIIHRDLDLMFVFAYFFNRFKISKKIRPIEIVTEFKAIILAELDMQQEAKNSQRLRDNFANSTLLYVPKVYWDLSTKQILTTERIYGTPVGNISQLKANNANLKQLAEDGVIIFFTQVFKHNFFHADMHPGNIFIDDNNHYIGVDFGIMGELDESDKNFLATIFLAFFNQNYLAVANAYIESGWASSTTDVKAFEIAIKRICSPMFEKNLDEISFGQVLMDLMAEAKNFDITVQPQLLLLDKTLLNIEGLGRQLYPKLDLWATAKPFLEDFTKQKYSLKNVLSQLSQQTPDILKELPDFPKYILGALKQNNNLTRLHNQQTTALIDQLKINAQTQITTSIVTAFILLSGILAINDHFLLAFLIFIISIAYFKSKSLT